MGNEYLVVSLICVSSYLIGGIPFGYIIVKLVKGIDIREYGSKNIGATNVARVLGRKYFFIIFILDALKGFAPVFILQLVVDWEISKVLRLNPGGTYLLLEFVIEWHIVCALAGVFAILGHMFPIYLKFKGGKGVATGAGVIFALSWQVGVIATAVWLIAFFASGYVSLASIITALSLPIAYILLNGKLTSNPILAIFFTLMAIIVIIKHSANIKRLVSGTESKVLWAKKSQ